MRQDPDVDEVAEALLSGVGVLVRRVRQLPVQDRLTMPERSVLSRLDRDGPASSAELARAAQITAQSMGATVAGLVGQGLVERRRDPGDGRRVIVSVTTAGLALLDAKRHTRGQQLAHVLTEQFTEREIRQLAAAAPLLERLGRSIPTTP
ncbi:MarR family winged helix-turn-helix transcriptional regulator [Williamsia sterculiae]|uniref:DNA-binding transcriptional regulator, MarR family n=1 Tax=Williamsia sterculiae TaxID=1344003 RepID=A0A1N7FWZ2_9NOCA|nr:MarR family winged helix-turn-helix transcriptional regulator [Williamsia sterculiae]SIS04840.1 DNA-binding transcriptional regulator, MarR family [Williamsia sterculiae]